MAHESIVHNTSQHKALISTRLSLPGRDMRDKESQRASSSCACLRTKYKASVNQRKMASHSIIALIFGIWHCHCWKAHTIEKLPRHMVSRNFSTNKKRIAQQQKVAVVLTEHPRAPILRRICTSIRPPVCEGVRVLHCRALAARGTATVQTARMSQTHPSPR